MLKAELLEVIANGENSGIEFKRDDIRPEQLAREIVAMLNFQGGMVLLGVEDDGVISGTQRNNLEEWVMEVIQSKVHPMLLPFYEEVRVDKDKKVAVISFPQGISKPYVLRHSGKEEVYIRVGSTSRLATREQQMRLFELGGMLHTEVMPVPRTDINSLDMARLQNYLKDVLQDPTVPSTQEAWQQRLLGLGFLVEAAGNVCCSIAGLVLFGKQPRKHLKQAGLRVIVYEGNNKTYATRLDEILDAPMVGRWDTMPEKSRPIDQGLIERFNQLIKPFITQSSETLADGLRTTLKWQYPVEAVRETVVNALAHRDWTRFVDIEVSIYSDRIEIISPGALTNSMTVEKMIAGQRSPRNPLIVEVLRDYGYVEHRGMGVRVKVIPLMLEASGRNPSFEETEDYLKTVLYQREVLG